MTQQTPTTQPTNWIPIRKIGIAALSTPFWALLLAFAPSFGVNLNVEQKDALKGFLYAVVAVLSTAYAVNGEPLQGSAPAPTPTPTPNSEENSDNVQY